ncbi:MAG: ABC transporter permease, partial [Chthoniobacteraceae bacterium]
MKPWTMVWRGAAYYWRTHLGVILGSAVAAMVLIGSLLVGDSVKATLKRQALARVGQTNVALVAGDRFFRQELADDVGQGAAPVLMLRGSVSVPGGAARINQAQVLGVDDRYWKLAPDGRVRAFLTDGAIINHRTATQLGAKTGDTIIIRLEKPGAFSRDAPLSGDESDIVAMRVTITDIVGDDGFGRFSLVASQVPPFTVFVPLEALQKQLEFAGKANLLLSTDGPEKLAAAVAAEWQLADASLELRELPNESGYELRSPRVFLDDTIVAAAPDGTKALTYFVNEIRAGDRAVPYSMVTGVESGRESFLPADLGEDEIVLNAWTAEDLNVEEGEEVTLKYFVIGEQRTLLEKSSPFKVVAIVPMSEPALNSSWMPEFPGLHDAENCRDWKPGFAIDMTKLRDKDQDYWDQYRGTPKAFINLKVAREMWGNRWGDVTTIRYPSGQTEAEIATAIRAKLTPPAIGLQVVPIREQALAATNAPVDFGELFVSFSFFLIAAAAALTGLLFVFTLEQRNAEAGTELALGLPARLVRRLLLCEGALLAIVGTLLGAVGALIFTKLVLRALSTVWNEAVGAVQFEFAATLGSLLGGSIASVLMAVFAMWLASRRQLRKSARALLSGGDQDAISSADRKLRRTRWPLLIAIVCLLAALCLVITSKSPEVFFTAGSLLLISGLAGGLAWLRHLAADASGLKSLNA